MYARSRRTDLESAELDDDVYVIGHGGVRMR
jgi:hypothetical protein